MNSNLPIRSRGLSLVELMVALTISLVVMAAVGAMFINTQKAYRAQEATARIQENGRFALHYLIQDIRMAGHFGCQSSQVDSKFSAGKPNVVLNVSADGAGNIPYPFNLAIPLEGVDGGNTATWVPSATALPTSGETALEEDMIGIRMADYSSMTYLTAAMPNAWAPLQVYNPGNTKNYRTDDIVLISDCATMDVLQITSDMDATPETWQHVKGGTGGPFAPGNRTATLSKAYGDKDSGLDPKGGLRAVKIFKLITKRYYIRKNADTQVPGLWTDVNGANPVELVEGIEDLQVLYGVGALGVERYVRAHEVGGSWAQVKSVRVGILARTPTTEGADVSEQTYQVLDKQRTYNDRHRRRVFEATIALRNMGLAL